MSASVKQNGKVSIGTDRRMFGANLNFSAKEAYKLLRTNLEFSLADVTGCRVIGVTSSMRGEGKSLTALNLSYSVAESGKRVLLIEGDMRLPTLTKQLQLHVTENIGLSDVIADAGMRTIPIRKYTMKTKEDSEVCFSILTSGSVPPNPSELLGSERMKQLLSALRESYDYIVLDLPPVLAVTDALVGSKIVDGVIMVVRCDYADKGALQDAIRQLRYAGGAHTGLRCELCKSG